MLDEEDEILGLSRGQTDDQELLTRVYTNCSRASVQSGKLMKRPFSKDGSRSARILGKNTWGYRELEWFSSEKRLLFDARSAEERTAWVEAIQAAMAKLEEV